MDEPKSVAPPAAYVNFLKVGSQTNEFFLSFGQLAAQGDTAHLVAALVTSPAHAKAMSRALATAVERYEEQFGPLPEAEPGAPRGAAGTKERAGAVRKIRGAGK